MKRSNFILGECNIAPGQSALVDLPISDLSNRLSMKLPVKVFHGKSDGPTLFVSAAIHGDEIIGIEIIRRLIKRTPLENLKGTLLLVPLVNGYGFLNHSRYLPDRRDLNRFFPGNERGSLAERLAYVFSQQIVMKSDYGIDLHSAAIHRENLPQIRIGKNVPEVLDLAKAFGAPVIVRNNLRDGSLRKSSEEMNVPVLLFEGGEGLRFDETAIRAGMAGILRVMTELNMLDAEVTDPVEITPFLSNNSFWLRAPSGGMLRLEKALGDAVSEGDKIGVVNDLFGENQFDVISQKSGIVIGRASLPIVNEGDAIMHIATADDLPLAQNKVETIVDHLDSADMFYEDEII